MDLFTKRCGCGAIYKPRVATSRACAKCSDTALAAQRAQVTTACKGEKKLKTYDYSQATVFIGGIKCEGFQDGETITIEEAPGMPYGQHPLDNVGWDFGVFRANLQRVSAPRHTYAAPLGSIERWLQEMNTFLAGKPMCAANMKLAQDSLARYLPPAEFARWRLCWDYENSTLTARPKR